MRPNLKSPALGEHRASACRDAGDHVGEDQDRHAVADPRWVISSPSHMTKQVPVVRVRTMKAAFQ